MDTDVAIVGGGPAGCFAGKILAERGFDVVIVEEHGEIGNPSCCAGIVGVAGLNELEIKPEGWVLGKLRRVKIYPPTNQPIELGRGKVEAFVVDRAEFDRSLARTAAEKGATILLKSRCVDLKPGPNPTLKLEGIHNEQLRARLVIGADGPASSIARMARLSQPSNYIKCAQVEVIAETQEDVAEIYLGHSLAPGFFGWVVQAGDVSRVGLGCTEGSPTKLLGSFLNKHHAISGKTSAGAMGICVGAIPQSPSRKLGAGQVLLIGDAAGHVKPLTGGGIYTGLYCARLAAESVASALETGTGEEIISAYEKSVHEKFDKEFKLGVRARTAFEQLSDEDLDLISGLLGKDDIRKIVTENFDFDHHGKVIMSLVAKAPEILRGLGLKRILKYTRYFMK